ncbi:MAG: DegT/DnrJ/EryC1/StrS family aminotransferase [Armatimonadetes bacterium]|nr:DegT/DnrJ/EryC1/StrS family aminotransferase [Armatimonadota bacterium]
MSSQSSLAINGGPKLRAAPFPPRIVLGPEEKAAVDKLLDDANAGGPPIGYDGAAEQAFCNEFAESLDGGYADAVNSGTSAVYIALRALELEPFSEVIVGPITDAGGFMPVPLINCIPVVPDSAPGQYNTGHEQIEAMISPLTSAIIVAHIGGEPADMSGIMAVACRHKIPVIEDCAQAHGAKLNGRLVGTFGDIAAFSTMFGKHFCTGGQGGVVYTRDEGLYLNTKRASDRGKPFGLPEGCSNSIASLNFNLNDLSAAIGREQLKKLPRVVRQRRELAARLFDGLSAIQAVRPPPTTPGVEPSYWFVRLEVAVEKLNCSKDEFCKALLAEGVPISPSYRHLPHTQDWCVNRRVFGSSGLPWSSPSYRGDPNRIFLCPNAEAAVNAQFNLNLHEGWGEQEVADTIAAMRKVESAYLKGGESDDH